MGGLRKAHLHRRRDRAEARLEDPHLLICETCVATGTRISVVTGLKIKALAPPSVSEMPRPYGRRSRIRAQPPKDIL